MTPLGVRPSALPPKTLVLRDVAVYLGLGSVQAAERWLKAHDVPTWLDHLGYRRASVRAIDDAQRLLEADALGAPRRLQDAS